MKSLNATQQRTDVVRDALETHIAPLLPGAALSGPYPCGLTSSFIVCYNTMYNLQVRLAPFINQYFTFERAHPFSEEERSFLEEILRTTHDATLAGGARLHSVMANSVTHAVSRHVAPEFADTLMRVINAYEERPLHGQQRLAHTTGIRLMRRKNTQGNFFGLEERELVKTMGAAKDTLVVIDTLGGICNVEKVPPITWESKRGQETLAPTAYMSIAAWANSRRKVAVRLEEDGSILLFNRGRLLFAKQGACWRCPPHTLAGVDALPASIDGIEPETAKAVYLTALDLATGHTDIYINLVRSAGEQAPAKPGKGTFKLAAGKSSKTAKLLSAMVNTRKFQEIPRPLRAEVCSGGASLLLDGQGCILGVNLAGKSALVPKTERSGPCSESLGCPYLEFMSEAGRSKLYLTIY